MSDLNRPADTPLLKNARQYGTKDGRYFIIDGEFLELPHRVQLLTRGEGRANAATRIPLRLVNIDRTIIQRVVMSLAKSGLKEVSIESFLKALLHETNHLSLSDFELLLIEMPRAGNKISGLEWDAPGGVAEAGEDLESIARREFDEEAGDLNVLAVESPFPKYLQFSSGAYDEVQYISFALVYGQPATLVEGARRWRSVSLSEAKDWFLLQNDPDQHDDSSFAPVDGKVILATLWLIEWLKPFLC